MLQRSDSAKTAREARQWTEACKNLIIGIAILLDDPARLNALVGGRIVKPHGKNLATTRHDTHLLTAIPKCCGRNVIARNLIAGSVSERDNRAGLANRDIKNIAGNRHSVKRPNEKEISHGRVSRKTR